MIASGSARARDAHAHYAAADSGPYELFNFYCFIQKSKTRNISILRIVVNFIAVLLTRYIWDTIEIYR